MEKEPIFSSNDNMELRHQKLVITVLLVALSFGLCLANSRACRLYRNIGINDLSLNDITIKSPKNENICLKAKFAMAIKLEEFDKLHQSRDDATVSQGPLGYLPLDKVVKVEHNCPESDTEYNITSEGNMSFSMIVHFECGHLEFIFQKDQARYYLSYINGTINIDSVRSESIEVDRRMFLTSDLRHHFFYRRLIEVKGISPSPDYIFTAQFYNSEFEVFRHTKSHDFILPPDENSVQII